MKQSSGNRDDILLKALGRLRARFAESAWSKAELPFSALHEDCVALTGDAVFMANMHQHLAARTVVSRAVTSFFTLIGMAARARWVEVPEDHRGVAARGCFPSRWLSVFLVIERGVDKEHEELVLRFQERSVGLERAEWASPRSQGRRSRDEARTEGTDDDLRMGRPRSEWPPGRDRPPGAKAQALGRVAEGVDRGQIGVTPINHLRYRTADSEHGHGRGSPDFVVLCSSR